MTDPEEILITPVKYCQAKTKEGKQCCNKVTGGNFYCSRHVKLFKYPKPEDCPVCCESLSDLPQPLSCGHWVHKNCVLKWGKDQCPVCRSNITLTKKERSILDKTIQKTLNTDLDRQAIENLIRQDLESRGIIPDHMIIHEIDNDMDLMSTLLVHQIIGNINRHLSSTSDQLTNAFGMLSSSFQI